ncbi:hypothetical protein DFH06DRAFT_1479475 [Mycena polygramma]|nr:hypothetical protein DFH06DRAFT_1479475 [Mycena polygramma]
MHRCLEILEVVSLICDVSSQKSLARFARVCKAFRDPALSDVLWEEQLTLLNLLHCMPRDIWTEPDEDGDMALVRPVLPADWDRALSYACRVKRFNFDDRFRRLRYPGTAEFLETLRLCVPGHQLFPNLQSLGWYSYHEDTLPHVRLFLSPRLTDLGLSILQSAAHLSLLPIVATQCLLLKDVYISSSDELVGLSQTTSMLVLGLYHLRVLTIPTLGNDALEHLAQLPYLSELELETQNTIAPFSPAVLTSGAIFFPSLSYIVVSADNVDGIVSLFPLLSHAPLTKIELNLREMTSASATARCFLEMGLHCTKGHSSVTELTVVIPWRRDTGPIAADFGTYSVYSAQLLPLLSFTNLASVFLAPPLGFDLDDSIVADGARVATSQNSLSLLFQGAMQRALARHTGRAPPSGPVLPTALGPDDLARCLRVAAEVANPTEGGPARQSVLPSRPLGEVLSGVGTEWDLDSRTDQELLAAHPEREEELEHCKRWNAVSAALKALRTVRAEERYWTRRKDRE